MSSFYDKHTFAAPLGLEQVVDYWWSKKSVDIRTSCPAKVVEIDHAKSSVRVEPLIKVFINREKAYPLPEMVDVPLSIVCANDGKAGLLMPVAVGDIGVLTFADQDTADWLSGDGKSRVETPSDTAARENLSTGSHSYILSFEVGIFTRQAPLAIDPANVVLYNGKGLSIYEPSGKITHKNGGGSYTLEANGDQTLTNGTSTVSMVGGTNTITNGTSTVVQSGGTTTINGCTVTPTGNIITASGTDLDALLASYNAHVHTGGTLPTGLTGTKV